MGDPPPPSDRISDHFDHCSGQNYRIGDVAVADMNPVITDRIIGDSGSSHGMNPVIADVIIADVGPG